MICRGVVTQRLARAGALLGIRLLDSIVIGDRGHVSLRDESPALLEASADTP
jgi:DNA repair protein RadC